MSGASGKPGTRPSAKGTGRGAKARHRVVALCLPGVVAFDLTAPAQAFGSAHAVDGTPHYAFSTCSIDGAPVRTTSGFEVGAQQGSAPCGVPTPSSSPATGEYSTRCPTAWGRRCGRRLGVAPG
jgi:transcriptional regulator GlxA family with amidase domain